MSLTSIGDAEIYTETRGNGDDLLLVAGLGGSGTFWREQVDLLAASYRVTVYDHRGVGRSPGAPVVSTSEQLADDLLRLMDALGIERAHLVEERRFDHGKRDRAGAPRGGEAFRSRQA